MSSDIAPEPQQPRGRTVDSEQGLLLVLLAMVVLGVAAIFLVTA
jgi:hypothetical protein